MFGAYEAETTSYGRIIESIGCFEHFFLFSTTLHRLLIHKVHQYAKPRKRN